MTAERNEFQETLRRWTVFLGVLQVTAGCVVGLIPPSAVAWFRGIVMAHIEFVINGILMIVLGLVVRELRLSRGTLKVWFVTLQIGTWLNGVTGVAAAFLGASSKLMPTINEKFPPPNGVESRFILGLLLVCVAAILPALGLTLYGLIPWRGTTRTP